MKIKRSVICEEFTIYFKAIFIRGNPKRRFNYWVELFWNLEYRILFFCKLISTFVWVVCCWRNHYQCLGRINTWKSFFRRYALARSETKMVILPNALVAWNNVRSGLLRCGFRCNNNYWPDGILLICFRETGYRIWIAPIKCHFRYVKLKGRFYKNDHDI